MAKKIAKKKITKVKKKRNSFAKGHNLSVGNSASKGRQQYDREELATRTIDNRTVVRYFTLNSHLTINELKARVKNNEVTALESIVINAMINANAGDVYKMNALLDRIVGKVPDHIKHSVHDPYAGKTLEELMEEKRRLEKINRQTMNYIEANSESFRQQEMEAQKIVNATKVSDSEGD